MQKDFSQFIPLPATALVVNIFFGRQLASVISFPLLVLLTAASAMDANSAICMAAACIAAICSYSKQRHDLVFTGLLIAIAQALGFLASLAFAQPSSGIDGFAGLGKMVVLEFTGGIVSSIIAIGSLPFLENIFGFLTPFRLVELTSGDQPLLRKLEIEAPGTYQHSLAVANLAEAGARAVGADSNLARAGALYHDLGKSVSPKYFIENQLGDKNPHDEIAPEQSREKVLSHVKDGIDLALRYGLPKTIIDFIPMHQGTSLMAYFYHKACLRDGIDKVDPATYRYPGPKPNSKETAIVMLADVAEAVTHSMTDPSLEEIDATLSTVFENRYQDGQLSQSSLNYDELQLVKAAFTRVWRTLHHERLKYPTTTTGKMAVPPEAVPPPT
jgi:putative nucleotidyltransferase with HDIG domain